MGSSFGGGKANIPVRSHGRGDLGGGEGRAYRIGTAKLLLVVVLLCRLPLQAMPGRTSQRRHSSGALAFNGGISSLAPSASLHIPLLSTIACVGITGEQTGGGATDQSHRACAITPSRDETRMRC